MNSHETFWEKNPALLFGITLLVGTSGYLFWTFPWNWVWPLSLVAYIIYLRKWPSLLLLFGGLFYATFLKSHLESENVGYFSPSLLKPYQSPFTKGLIYQGMLTTAKGQRVPCSVHHPFTEDHPKANCDYVLKGRLKNRGPYDYIFQTKEWIPVKRTWGFAELRFQMKERLRAFLNQKLHRPRVATFLGSLLTGDVEERALRYEFGRLGLQHILAISGFHFAILIAFCSFFLSLFLPHKWKLLILLLAINTYFLFVGSVPAMQRSYLTALFFLTGKLLKRPSTGLNLLGASLLFEVLFDPFVSINLGFQLSFLSCMGIFLFRPLFISFAFRLFPAHRSLTLIDQHGYLITSFLREALAITLAINAALLPLILFHFHSFPLLSVLYNLFFPFLISISLFFLLLSLLIYLLFPLFAPPLFYLTDFLTAQWLDLVAYPPLFLDYSIRCNFMAAWLIPPYLAFLFFLSLHLTNTPQIR